MNSIIRNITDKEGVKAIIDNLDTSKEWSVKIVRKTRVRSISQNKLYFMWLNLISDETGEDVDTLHKVFARKFLGYDIRELYGEKIAVIKSTADLDTEQFTNYLDQINMFASMELDITLPYPQDKSFEDFTDKYK